MSMLLNSSRPGYASTDSMAVNGLSSVLTNTDHRDALPPMNHPDAEKIKLERGDNPRHPSMTGLSISTASLGSPNDIYSAPPPPYSSIASTATSGPGLSGYISPPESTTRRSTRDERDSPLVHTSLPSIHEALGDRSMMHGPVPTLPPQSQGIVSASAPGQMFPDAPRGPPNPFSQPSVPIASARDISQPQSANATSQYPDVLSKPFPSTDVDSKSASLQPYTYPVSPRDTSSVQPPSSANHYSAPPKQPDVPSVQPPFPHDPRSAHMQTDRSMPALSHQPPFSSTFHFESNGKFEESRNPFARAGPSAPYSETVKRRLEIHDAVVALGEMTDASSRTADFSRFWSQRCHQGNRTNCFADGMPDLRDIDEMARQSQRFVDHLNSLRSAIVSQQAAISEERARVRPHADEYHGMLDEYKVGSFSGPDAKKRRGKAAPPGRCHSCNRAETPEWRRGPDGARTLCNACGLHYAKLTRKLGAHKNSGMAGSNLRPKHLDSKT